MLTALTRHAAIWRAAWSLDRGRPRIKRNADELAFLPAALEIIETPASPAGRAITWSIMGFFALAVTWSCLGEIEIHATATGRIIPSGKVKTVQPLELATVRRILVQDGQHVARGQPLIELDPTTSDADRGRIARDLVEAQAKAARLRAQLDGAAAAFAPPPAPEGLAADAHAAPVARQRRLLADRLAEQHAAVQALRREGEEREAEARALASEVARLEETVPLLRERARARETLAASGHGPRLQYLEVKQALVEREHELVTARHRLEQTRAAITGVAEKLRQTVSGFSARTLDELAEAERQADALSQELVKAGQRSALLTLTAPVDGTVQQLAMHTEGGVVTPAQPALVVVPDGAGLEVEAMLANKDAGFVVPGQAVEIKVETFPFTRHGTIPGEVLHLSRDSVTPDPVQGAAAARGGGTPTEPVFVVRIRLDRTTMAVDGRAVALSAGMAVAAEIKTGRRRLIEYLLAPMLRYRDESLRER